MSPQHAAYLKLLAKWNATVNLTSLKVDPPDDAAIERLIEEPIRAARLVRPQDRLAVDFGSGGGSPALPLKIACPHLRFVLVESRARKCAFLRTVVRELNLQSVEVIQDRFEAVALRPELRSQVDVVTSRAIRPNDQFWTAVSSLMSASGRVLWFGGGDRSLPGTFEVCDHEGSTVAVIRKVIDPRIHDQSLGLRRGSGE